MRTRNFLDGARIAGVEQLTEKSEAELRKCRNVGKKTVVEIRIALARFGLSLRGENPPTETPDQESLDLLLREQTELEGRLRQIKEKIEHLKASKDHKPNIASAVFAKWLELNDYGAVAQEFSITPSRVSSIVSHAYRLKLKNGDLNEFDIFFSWKEKRNYAAVAQKFLIPEFLVRNIVIRRNK